MNLICPYCQKESEKVTGDVVYPHRPDLYRKVFYHCAPCGAYVGCHPGTDRPLGRLANAELRHEKVLAHAALDLLWRSGKMSRTQAYDWLRGKLGIPVDDCHIGLFNVDMCREVVRVCQEDEQKSKPEKKSKPVEALRLRIPIALAVAAIKRDANTRADPRKTDMLKIAEWLENQRGKNE